MQSWLAFETHTHITLPALEVLHAHREPEWGGWGVSHNQLISLVQQERGTESSPICWEQGCLKHRCPSLSTSIPFPADHHRIAVQGPHFNVVQGKMILNNLKVLSVKLSTFLILFYCILFWCERAVLVQNWGVLSAIFQEKSTVSRSRDESGVSEKHGEDCARAKSARPMWVQAIHPQDSGGCICGAEGLAHKYEYHSEYS